MSKQEIGELRHRKTVRLKTHWGQFRSRSEHGYWHVDITQTRYFTTVFDCSTCYGSSVQFHSSQLN